MFSTATNELHPSAGKEQANKEFERGIAWRNFLRFSCHSLKFYFYGIVTVDCYFSSLCFLVDLVVYSLTET